MATKIDKKSPQIFYCNNCDYSTSKKTDFNKHLGTDKHIRNTLATQKSQNTENLICQICNKNYHNRTGLWRHQKICNLNILENDDENTIIKENIVSPEMIMSVLQQNNNLQQLLMEQNKTILELSKNNQNIINNNNNITNTNSHNKTFNLQFFLNETCKDAMNLSDFINSFKIQLSDLESVGKLGFVDGISNIIIKKLQALDVEKRPIHCCDAKRETMYIKDQDKWEKDDSELKRMKELVRNVRDKNITLIATWRDLYPECVKSNSKKTSQFNEICMEAFGGETGGDKGTKQEKEDKIISRIAKSVIIDKS
jgi:hypothetical protein